MRITVFLFTGYLLLFPLYLNAQQNEKLKFNQSKMVESTSIKSKSPMGAMIRSAIFPGWGQVYNNKYIKALVYLGGESYFVYRYIAIDQEVENLKNDGSLNATEEDIEIKENQRNGWAWLFSAGYLLALGDAYVDAHLYGLDSDNNLSIGIKPDNRLRSLQLQLHLTF